MEYRNTKHIKKFKRDTSQESVVCFKIREARGTGWLSFNNMKLYKVPAEIYSKTKNLKFLYMSKCQLKGELLAELGQLSKLTVLDASFNQLVSVPDSLFANLSELEIVDLSHNRLSTLPYTVGMLEHCRELSVARNHLVALPHTVAHMRRLEILDASQNMIRVLQGAILTGGLTGTLHVLRLGGNQLDRLPREVGWLSALEELDVSNNALYFLPDTCTHLTRLKVLRFSGNKWTSNLPYFQLQPQQQQLDSSYGVNARKTATRLVYPIG